MATTIRMSRHGSKKRPYYRIIVTDSRAPRDGRRLDEVGSYDPLREPVHLRFDEERLAHWLSRGARPSLTVSQLIARAGVASAASTEVPATPAEATAAEPAPAPAEAQG